MGRSYGDACLNSHGTLWVTAGLDHFVEFDDATGRLVCEPGVLLRDIQQVFVSRGWMLPVTPGTQWATVGGAVANDVHGKNHHRFGCFGEHVRRLTIMRTDGECIQCGPDHRPEWFAATVGGLGLTGIITEVELQLRRVPGPWLQTETIPYSSLREFFALAAESESDWEYTVSWIDCLARGERGIFLRANHAEVEAQKRRKPRGVQMPFDPPLSLVNKLTLRPLNAAYYYLQKRQAGRRIAHFEPFFYPLDHVSEWNRMYGPKGFYQYQCVLPMSHGHDAVDAMLKEIATSGEGSFLAVLKTFGNRHSVGFLSFPQPGVTLALDFPNRGARTHKLFTRLDAIVEEAKGRLYPAKDARMPKWLFEAGYPQLDAFMAFRDPGVSSDFSRRLMGC